MEHPDNDFRVVLCEACGSEGRTIVSYGTGYDRVTGYYQDDRDEGLCPHCDGTGGEIIEVQPIEESDLERIAP